MADTTHVINGIVTPKSTKPYLLFLSGQLTSLFGSSIVQFALVWWITVIVSAEDPGSVGTALGIASFLGFAPMIFTTMFAGVFVDRWNRKKVILFVDFMQAFATAILILLFYLNIATIVHVLIILAIRSFFQGFHTPAVQAIIPILVPRNKLTQINSFEYLANGIIFLVGPVIGALIVTMVGIQNIGLIMTIDIITFMIAVIPLLLIHIPSVKRKPLPGELIKKTSFVSEFNEGISFIKQKKGLLSLLTTFSVSNIIVTPVGVLMPLVAVLYFSTVFIGPLNLVIPPVTVLAFSIASLQIGSIIMSIILTSRRIFKSNVNGVVLGQGFMYLGLLLIVISILISNFYLLLLATFIQGITLPLANVHSQTIWQSVVPPELQGRVMSVRMVIAWIFNPFSMLFAGILADIISIQIIFTAGAIIGLMFIVFVWFFTGLPSVEERLGIKKTQSPSIELEKETLPKILDV